MTSINQLNVIVLCVLGSILLQDARGYVIDETLTHRETSDLLSPVNEITQHLNSLLKEIELKKAEVNKLKEEVSFKISEAPEKCLNDHLDHHSSVLNAWSFDSCVNCTDDLKTATEYLWNCSQLTWNLTSKAGEIANNILNCPGWNVAKTVKCYNTNLGELKNLVDNVKNITMPMVKEGFQIARKIRLDFDYCLGIPVASNMAIEQHLENCR